MSKARWAAGSAMKWFQKKPVRWFSIAMTVMPASMPMMSVLIQSWAGLKASTKP